MRLERISATSEALRATRARTTKAALLADAIRELQPDEIEAGVAFLSGELRQRQIGAGWASLRELPPAAAEPSLTVAEVDDVFAQMAAASGPGSAGERRRLLADLLTRATEPEQQLLSGLVMGELRQGAQASLVADAIAAAAGVAPAELRRALMLRGDLGAVAVVALTEGAAGLARIRLVVGRPLAPMLASPAASIEEALATHSPASVEWKLDGARVQAHRDGDDVALFTRSLDDVTTRLPEVAAAVRALPVRSLVADAEAILLRPDGRPAPFQETASAFARGSGSTLDVLLFDLLHLDGDDLLDQPLADRRAALEGVAGSAAITRVVTDDVAVAAGFYDDALARGHEGVMVKSLDATYEAGRRGSAWLKVKRTHTLDLVVLAVEWGSGRRRGLLSNLHLGARDEATGGFVMLGKTFKGLTDAVLAWQTEQLLARETGREGHVVHVRPELVVEIAFDGIQASTRYPGGMALRFARVKGYRPDKRPDEADTIETVRAIFAGVDRMTVVERPRSLEEALALRARYTDAAAIAGGTDLMVEVNGGRRKPDRMIDLTGVPELLDWERRDTAVRLGAGVPYTRLIAELSGQLPGLAHAARTVGSPQIRNRGTVGGNLATASPAGDALPPLVAVDAVVEVASQGSRRTIGIGDFLLGPKRTSLAPDELIVAVEIPAARGPQVFSKIGARNAMVIAVASFALDLDPSGRVGAAIGSAGPTVLRAPEAEAFLAGAVAAGEVDDAVAARFGELCAAAARPIDDLRGTAAYRRHAVGVMARRAVTWAMADIAEGDA